MTSRTLAFATALVGLSAAAQAQPTRAVLAQPTRAASSLHASVSAGAGAGSDGRAVRLGVTVGGRVAYLVRATATWVPGDGVTLDHAAEISSNARLRLVRLGPLDLAASAGLGLGYAAEGDRGDIFLDIALDYVVPVEAEATLRLWGPVQVSVAAHRSTPLGVINDDRDASRRLPPSLSQWSVTAGLRFETP